METPFDNAVRLLNALEDLVSEETTLIRTMDFVEAVAVRERAAPLVERLCALAEDPALYALRPRVEAYLDRGSQNQYFLEVQLNRLHTELTRVNEARGRLQHVAPVYKMHRSSQPFGASRLNTAA